MTPEAQRIAIHEALGWTKVIEGPCHYAWERGDKFHYVAFTPNYLSDLNAMHEAEKVLTEEQHCEYALDLYHVVHEHTKRPTNADRYAINSFGVRILIIATATQRAEAFLRTLNLWTT